MRTFYVVSGILMVAALAVLPLAANASPLDEKMLPGEWRYDSGGEYPVYDIYIFESGGTGTHKHGGDGWENADDITWKFSDGRLEITDSYGTTVYDYEFNDMYSELTLTDVDYPDSSLTYKRQGSICGALCCGAIYLPVAVVGGITLLAARKR